jgi:hypothetical protein
MKKAAKSQQTKEITKEVKTKPKRKRKPSKSYRCIISLINGPKSDGKAAGGEGDIKQETKEVSMAIHMPIAIMDLVADLVQEVDGD